MKGDRFFTQMASRPPFSRLHPRMAGFLREYLSQEKVVSFRGQAVVNTHFPPYPSPAFDHLASHFEQVGEDARPPLHSITLAVTNRCPYRCWHCYNAGRAQRDLPLEDLRRIAAELQDLGAVMVGLSGGEPLLRDDLEEIAGAFDPRTCLTMNTTGSGLTAGRAERLRARGLFAVGISLDAAEPGEHDRLRGHPGAFDQAVAALRTADQAGLYPYVVAVATRTFLEPERFWRYAAFAAAAGAREIHLLEPSPTGRLAGRDDVRLGSAERQRLLEYQRCFAEREDLPILSSLTYLESAGMFGCGAGLTHLYIDGSGEVCPCNLVPLSFGNAGREPLGDILSRMGRRFRQPRTACVGRILNRHVPAGPVPTPPAVSEHLCDSCLPAEHPLPRFFQVRQSCSQAVGQAELQAAYDHVHEAYDAFWVAEAGRPVADLVARLDLAQVRRALEAGCGTGFGTALLAARLPAGAELTAIDLSTGMLAQARRRLGPAAGVRWVAGDALAALENAADLDLVFTSWVLGYIPLAPFFAVATGALRPGGALAFVVHREDSPAEPLEIFAELVARDPSVLLKRVAFDFPADLGRVHDEAERAGFSVEQSWEGQVAFRYDRPEQVLEHLLKSGAGTAFYEAVDPSRREELAREFVRILGSRRPAGSPCEVVHEYIAAILRRTA